MKIILILINLYKKAIMLVRNLMVMFNPPQMLFIFIVQTQTQKIYTHPQLQVITRQSNMLRQIVILIQTHITIRTLNSLPVLISLINIQMLIHIATLITN